MIKNVRKKYRSVKPEEQKDKLLLLLQDKMKAAQDQNMSPEEERNSKIHNLTSIKTIKITSILKQVDTKTQVTSLTWTREEMQQR